MAPPKLATGAWVVTGAASGFGREFARRIVGRGAPVALFDRDAAGLAETAALLGGARVHHATVDLLDDGALARAVQEAREALGTIAHCVHCAGVLKFGRVEDMAVDDFRRMMEVNYLGSVKAAQATLPHLREAARGGRSLLLLTASIAGLRAAPEVGAYSASKFAVVGLAQALRDELAGTGVDVRALCPPPGDTPMLRNQPSLPPIYKVTKTLSAEQIVARALDAVDHDQRLEMIIDAQSRALIAASRFAPALSEWIVRRIAG